MTGNRAGLGAQTFLLPQPTPQQAAPAQQPYNDGVQALEGLQYVQGQTSDYYKKVADLKAFMQSVNQNLGIDVRVPDLSRPESLKLNEIYRNAIADIQAQGNELKQGSAINNMLISRGDIQTSSYGDQSAARAQYGRDFFNRNLEPSIMELNNKLQMPSYTKEEYEQKENARQQAVNYWTEQAKNPEMKEYAEYQLRGISPTTQGQWRPQSTYQDRAWGRKVEAAGNWLNKTSNLILGSDESYQPNEKVLNSTRDGFVLSSYEFANTKVGDASVVRFDHDPEANGGKGTTTMILRRNDGATVPVDITNLDPQTVVTKLSQGLDPGAITEYIDKNNYQDKYQRTLREEVAGGGVEERRKQVSAGLKELNEKRMRPAVQAINSKLLAMKSKKEKGGWFPSDDEQKIGSFIIRKIRAANDTDQYELVNVKELIESAPNAKALELIRKANKYYDATSAGLEKLQKLMASFGVYKDYIEGLDEQIPAENPTENTQSGTNSAPTPLTKGSLD